MYFFPKLCLHYQVGSLEEVNRIVECCDCVVVDLVDDNSQSHNQMNY